MVLIFFFFFILMCPLKCRSSSIFLLLTLSSFLLSSSFLSLWLSRRLGPPFLYFIFLFNILNLSFAFLPPHSFPLLLYSFIFLKLSSSSSIFPSPFDHRDALRASRTRSPRHLQYQRREVFTNLYLLFFFFSSFYSGDPAWSGLEISFRI